LIAFLLIVHGLIVAAQSTGSFKPRTGPIGLENPSFVSWWPTRLGQSWLLSALGLERFPTIAIGGLLWLISGLALLTAGLALGGVIVPQAWWSTLAIAGALGSLVMLIVYLHPLMVIGTLFSAAILIAQLWAHWPPPELIGV
jgi:hypothetical protein